MVTGETNAHPRFFLSILSKLASFDDVPTNDTLSGSLILYTFDNNDDFYPHVVTSNSLYNSINLARIYNYSKRPIYKYTILKRYLTTAVSNVYQYSPSNPFDSESPVDPTNYSNI